ncbi:MAG: TRAP transporter substrate-binding protein [Myxococcota bacterium]
MARWLTLLLALLTFGSVQAADGPTVIKLATVAPDGSPWAQGLQEFKKLAEEGSGGKIKVKLFLGGTLGDENETVLACKRGQIQAVGASTGAVASQVPEVNVLELPFLFNTLEEADHILDVVAGASFDKYFKDRGLVLGFWSENGFRSFGGKFPVSKPADLAGRKMRSQENPIHLATYRAFGASPVPIPTTEALTALQTGVVDGYDQTPLYAFAASWHTASTHYSISNHIYQPAAIVYHKPFFDSLPKDVQDALAKAGAAVVKNLRKNVRALTPILIENLTASGLKVNTLTDAEKAEFAKLAAKVREDYVKGASKGEQDLYALIQKGLADFRKGGKK